MIVKKPYEKEFVKSGGSICPFCEGSLSLSDFQAAEHMYYKQRMLRRVKCSNCKKQFYAVYEIISCKVDGESWRPIKDKKEL